MKIEKSISNHRHASYLNGLKILIKKRKNFLSIVFEENGELAPREKSQIGEKSDGGEEGSACVPGNGTDCRLPNLEESGGGGSHSSKLNSIHKGTWDGWKAFAFNKKYGLVIKF